MSGHFHLSLRGSERAHRLPLDWLFPQCCLLCGGTVPGTDGGSLCGSCRGNLPRMAVPSCELCSAPLPAMNTGQRCGSCLSRREPYRGIIAALDYKGTSAWLVRRFKFHASLAAGRELAGLMGQMLHARTSAPEVEVIVPLPLHVARLRQRGFDQAGVLATDLGRALGLPVAPLLVRTRATAPQSAAQDAVQRRANVRGAFSAGNGVKGLRIALLDDVVTTGSTVGEASRVLRRAGAAEVVVWCAARTPSPA